MVNQLELIYEIKKSGQSVIASNMFHMRKLMNWLKTIGRSLKRNLLSSLVFHKKGEDHIIDILQYGQFVQDGFFSY